MFFMGWALVGAANCTYPCMPGTFLYATVLADCASRVFRRMGRALIGRMYISTRS
jgi:hypothetical protein